MAKTRYTGKLGKMYLDADGGTPTTYTQITAVRNIQPPTVSRARIDVTGMEDTAAETRPGIEEEREFSFEFLWDPDDTVDASVRTCYDNESLAHFKAEFTDGTTTLAIEWSGYLTALEPIAVDGSSGVAMRAVGVVSGSIEETVT